MGFKFEIQYRIDISNKVADTLSRKDSQLECDNLCVGEWKSWDKLKDEISHNELIQGIRKDLERDPKAHKGSTCFTIKCYSVTDLLSPPKPLSKQIS